MNAPAILHESSKLRHIRGDEPLAPGDLVVMRTASVLCDEGCIGRIVTIDDDKIVFIHLGAWLEDSVFPAYNDTWELPWCWLSSVTRVPAQMLRVAS